MGDTCGKGVNKRESKIDVEETGSLFLGNKQMTRRCICAPRWTDPEFLSFFREKF